MYNFKKDTYQTARGGSSRVLDITCDHCGEHITYYQKDGPGMLKRMYADRFIDSKPSGDTLSCNVCKRELATKINYEKEDRVAYRLFAGAINKKIVSRSKIVKEL